MHPKCPTTCNINGLDPEKSQGQGNTKAGTVLDKKTLTTKCMCLSWLELGWKVVAQGALITDTQISCNSYIYNSYIHIWGMIGLYIRHCKVSVDFFSCDKDGMVIRIFVLTRNTPANVCHSL